MSLELLLDICTEKKVEVENVLYAGEGQEIHRIVFNRGIKFPRILILNGHSKENYNPTGIRGICRFLSAYPLDKLPKVYLEIFPKINCIVKDNPNRLQSYKEEFGLGSRTVEGTCLFTLLHKTIYNLCVEIRDTDDAYFRLDYDSMKRGELTFKILDTASRYFNIEKEGRECDGVGRRLIQIPRVDRRVNSPLEVKLKYRCNYDLLRVYFPLCYSDYDRVACCSKIIEDCLWEFTK